MVKTIGFIKYPNQKKIYWKSINNNKMQKINE
jgi:hypothetical protein